ncbi:glucose-6-phosphate/phosphate, putative [Theileria equi strain WA]|uniref:Glucose-6-phosphate/phosphate, putative n=1 Tax=Theileria equi strain WA TaxID=1537102 RepID=L1LBE0_THEEQ|nr:glucose-6-phosphate/phosphate, putative [Theileria equi strain WA]EKX72651.1 glucose-6-phosphate/phosphate, putative [Theileria equi strain WA]|eukprot:XP_004832103.1 glucose-6-phosphate/phosphate, putative [Theileria equi strain WA]
MANNSKDSESSFLLDGQLGDLEISLPTKAFSEKTDALKGYFHYPSFSVRLSLLFLGWYFLNAWYVVENKVILLKLPLPWTLSAMQLTVGWLFALLFWGTGIRSVPSINSRNTFFRVIVPQGLCHLFVHLGAVVSMGIGAVSFTHVVKAAEPVITALFSIIFLQEYLNTAAYLSLIPIVLGIALASVKELHFNWIAFWFAMISNAGSSIRSIFAKVTMKNKDEIGTNLSTSNLYLLMTLVASVASVPLVYFTEYHKWAPLWIKATSHMTDKEKVIFVTRAFVSCVCYYLCNDLAFICLGEINQVTHAIANTLKRIVLIGTAIMVFNYRITALGYLGITIAISGTFSYAVSK